jgi:hypothetical protein
VDGDVGQPGGEPLRLLELREVRIGANVGVLQDVLGLALVAQERAQDAKKALVVAAHDQLEEGRLAAQDAPDQLGVFQGPPRLRQHLGRDHEHLPCGSESAARKTFHA